MGANVRLVGYVWKEIYCYIDRCKAVTCIPVPRKAGTQFYSALPLNFLLVSSLQSCCMVSICTCFKYNYATQQRLQMSIYFFFFPLPFLPPSPCWRLWSLPPIFWVLVFSLGMVSAAYSITDLPKIQWEISACLGTDRKPRICFLPLV